MISTNSNFHTKTSTVAPIIVMVMLAIVLFIGFMLLMRSFNAATLHTQIVNPTSGIECVVVSASDSTSVDCWKTDPREN